MPKVTLYIATSEDGFIADKNGGVDWLPPPDPSAKDEVGYNKFYSSMDALAMGSITYEQILTFGAWPYQNKKSFVFTQRQLVKPKEKTEVEFTSLQVKNFMEYLDKLNVKNVWLVGGTKLISSFYQEGYIDEYIITTMPKVLGEGIALPKPILERKGLIETKCLNFGSGMRQFHYVSEKYNAYLKESSNSAKITQKEILMRYNFYSHIHRYMRHRLFEFEGLAAKTDFRKDAQRIKLKQQFDNLLGLLKGHAGHEEREHVALLKKKNSPLQNLLLTEHGEQDKTLESLVEILNRLMESSSLEVQKQLGYEFYLSYTGFVSHYLQHLIQEEKVIMPELWSFYTDEELKQLTFSTYRQMTVDDMNGMLQTLFPYINICEKEVFLTDIKQGTPDKFDAVWTLISPTLEVQEREELINTVNTKAALFQEQLLKLQEQLQAPDKQTQETDHSQNQPALIMSSLTSSPTTLSATQQEKPQKPQGVDDGTMSANKKRKVVNE